MASTPNANRKRKRETSTCLSYQFVDAMKLDGGIRRRDCIWNLSASKKESNLKKEATMVFFDKFKKASKAAKVLNEQNKANVPKVLALLGKKYEDGPAIIVERILPATLEEWLEYGRGSTVMWTLNGNKDQFLEMDHNHQRVFRSMVTFLADLHGKNKCHGNLRHGVFATDPKSKGVDICFANFDPDVDFEIGMKKDLQDLRHFVKLSVASHSSNQLPADPPALQSFYDLFVPLKGEGDIKKIRKLGIYICSSPLFFNWRDRKDFLDAIEEFSLQGSRVFTNEVIMDGESPSTGNPKYAIPKMVGWQGKIQQLAEKAPLTRLYDPTNRLYNHSGGIYRLHRNALHHPIPWVNIPKKSPQRAALGDLLETFPSAIPVIYEKMMDAFAKPRNKWRPWDLFLKEGLKK